MHNCGSGADKIDGRGGSDWIRYDRDADYGGIAGVKVDLSQQLGIDGFEKKDSLKSIENVLGTALGDTIKGSSVGNILNGGKGADVLSGGAGSDTFIFSDAYGKDTIMDFAPSGKSHDIIDLSQLSAINNFTSVKAHLSDHGHDVWLNAGHGDVLVIKGVEINDLTKADFHF